MNNSDDKKIVFLGITIAAAVLVLVLAFINISKYKSVTVEGIRYTLDSEKNEWYVNKAVDRSLERVSIEKEIFDVPVTYIADNAFRDCENLEKVKIPDSVKSIGESAFYNCSALETVNLPEDIWVLEGNLFYGCSSLKEISIPDSVQLIYACAFQNCKSLKSIDIPNNVQQLDRNVFAGCTDLEFARLPIRLLGDGYYSSYNKVFGSSDSISIELSEESTSISASVFRDWTNLKSITIPESVTKIDSKAFSGCTALESVRIPKSVSKIYLDTFSDCSSDLVVSVPHDTDIIDEVGTTYNLGFLNSGTSSLDELIFSAVGVRQYDYSWVKRMTRYS